MSRCTSLRFYHRHQSHNTTKLPYKVVSSTSLTSRWKVHSQKMSESFKPSCQTPKNTKLVTHIGGRSLVNSKSVTEQHWDRNKRGIAQATWSAELKCEAVEVTTIRGENITTYRSWCYTVGCNTVWYWTETWGSCRLFVGVFWLFSTEMLLFGLQQGQSNTFCSTSRINVVNKMWIF